MSVRRLSLRSRFRPKSEDCVCMIYFRGLIFINKKDRVYRSIRCHWSGRNPARVKAKPSTIDLPWRLILTTVDRDLQSEIPSRNLDSGLKSIGRLLNFHGDIKRFCSTFTGYRRWAIFLWQPLLLVNKVELKEMSWLRKSWPTWYLTRSRITSIWIYI